MRIKSFIFLTALATLPGTAFIPVRAQDDGVTWLGNYQEALRQARQTGKPIFLEFRCEA